jgi:hypothetical protein
MLQRETGTENGVVIILSLAKGNKHGNVKQNKYTGYICNTKIRTGFIK